MRSSALPYVSLFFCVATLSGLFACSQPNNPNNQNNQNNQRTPPGSSSPLPTPVIGKTVQLVPHSNLPKAIKTQPANNNLDVVEWKGRFYLSFRTAPKHFASDQVEMYVMSSIDQKSWDFEAKFDMDTDLREPRFFVWKNSLHIYFAQLGRDQAAFEPGQMYRSVRQSIGKWSQPEKVFKPGFIPWRFREYKGKPILVGYDGGENIYDFSGKPLRVYLLTTEDGKTWVPLSSQREFVLKGGASETDIAFDKEGNLFAVARNEAGDQDGFGSKICKASKDDITKWTCKRDPKKYDSPLLFRHGSEIYLVGRRNLTPTGNYDLGKEELDRKQKLADYQAAYWKEKKRCSIWRLDRKELKIIHLLDLPSKGDTCFPSIIQQDENKYLLYNYSSKIEGKDRGWLDGQLNPTFIYSHELSFQPSSP